jgi:hypothetical protein
MSLAEWDWVVGEEYIDLPDCIAKWGKGRVFKLPVPIMEALRATASMGRPTSSLSLPRNCDGSQSDMPHAFVSTTLVPMI